MQPVLPHVDRGRVAKWLRTRGESPRVPTRAGSGYRLYVRAVLHTVRRARRGSLGRGAPGLRSGREVQRDRRQDHRL